MNACDGDNPTDGVDADKWHRRHAGFAGNLFMDGFFARHIAFVCSATLHVTACKVARAFSYTFIA